MKKKTKVERIAAGHYTVTLPKKKPERKVKRRVTIYLGVAGPEGRWIATVKFRRDLMLTPAEAMGQVHIVASPQIAPVPRKRRRRK